MTIQLLKRSRKHPARDAAIQSISFIEARDREGWLSLWDEGGLIEDPVGQSPLDPEGKGHRGIDAITRFFDHVIAPSDLRFTIRQSFAAGDECANVGTITTRTKDGVVTRTELVMVYRVNREGKLVSLRAFWEFDDTAGSVF
ncbi:MAG: nuclear transport factor 2 family protein [Gammaproteobacteria bacterium]|nr:nuclear transport factor 2 family protein [Gammaproteobacteria bacterium]